MPIELEGLQQREVYVLLLYSLQVWNTDEVLSEKSLSTGYGSVQLFVPGLRTNCFTIGQTATKFASKLAVGPLWMTFGASEKNQGSQRGPERGSGRGSGVLPCPAVSDS